MERTYQVVNNQAGQMTIDFIFGLVLMIGFTAVLFALSLTLTMSEIAQYITFAAARNFYAGNVAMSDQATAGKAKYAALLGNKAIKPLFAGSWFSLSKDVSLGASTTYVEQPDQDSDIFVGAEATFTAPILKMNIPIFGSTQKDDKVFSAQIHLVDSARADRRRMLSVQQSTLGHDHSIGIELPKSKSR